MQKSDYVYMIIDNLTVFGIQLPDSLRNIQIHDYLDEFSEESLKIIAGFNQKLLKHFLKISQGKNQNDLIECLKKLELISHMVGPTGNLSYISLSQLDHILSTLDTLSLDEIDEQKINALIDEQLEKEFGAPQYSTSQALENQLASAAFYLMNMGYSQREIEQRLSDVRQNPSKLDELFSLPQKEIFSVPSEVEQIRGEDTESQDFSINHSEEMEDAINRHISDTHQEISEERARKVDEIMEDINAHVKDKMTDQYERVFRQVHPDRLARAYKMLKQTKRKSKRMDLLLEWFFCSHLLSSIELKVEHWQVSSQATHGQAGVYTAGIDFSRYDNIIRDFSDSKLSKVINIARKILQKPSKKAIQKLGQNLVAETGFDEHLYFTD
ncbi:MAG: hypothetical protein EU539_05660 [Promethearchaeota archaeon]|nr:MAG: hypothetical protein EU539_05660 [Candidatus Lokiarchaeota archaeon]